MITDQQEIARATITRAVKVAAIRPSFRTRALAASHQIGIIEQHSEGTCSPPIVNNQGQVSISRSGLAPAALRYLENHLSEQFSWLSEQLCSLDDSSRTIHNLNDLNENLRQQADDRARLYRELSARLAEARDHSAQAKQVRELIQQSKFAKAEAILQPLATKEDGDIAPAAATQYDLGDLAMLRFDPAGALPHYEKAFRYQPDNSRYADGYAQAAPKKREAGALLCSWMRTLPRATRAIPALMSPRPEQSRAAARPAGWPTRRRPTASRSRSGATSRPATPQYTPAWSGH